MTYAQQQDLSVFRHDPMQITLAVTGVDLTSSAPSFAIGRAPDQPGPPLVTLTGVTMVGAQGIRLVETTRDGDDIPTSIFEIMADKATIAGLPVNPDPDPASPTMLAYDLQWTQPAEGPGLSGVERTVLFGQFIILESANG